jgi:molybdopterin-biosynthesis enzyme MoeA-like protein
MTRQAVASAFGVPCEPHPEAVKRLKSFYGKRCTPRRLSMGEFPSGADLIDNPVMAAPGFRMENVFVLPGIPELVEAMFPIVESWLERGNIEQREFTVTIAESDYSDLMEEAQRQFPEIEIGSYPHFSEGHWHSTIVVKGSHQAEVIAAEKWLREAVEARALHLKATPSGCEL